MLLLPRFLSRAGVASRKAAEEMVACGRVKLNGRLCRDVLAVVVPGRDRVLLDGVPVSLKASHTWIALNKPRGVLCTTSDPEGRPTVMQLVPTSIAGLAPVGRLDQDTGGLLLLTDDHALAATLLDPQSHVEKTYRVKVRGQPGPEPLRRLQTETLIQDGLQLGPLKLQVERLTPEGAWLEVRLSEGKNRQIRRRFEAEGHPVEVLVRLGFGPVQLGRLKPGEHRALGADEVHALSAPRSC